MKRAIFTFLTILFSSSSFGQDGNIDSIHWALRNETDPVGGILLHFKAANVFHTAETADQCVAHLSKAKQIAEVIKNDTLLAKAYTELGLFYYHLENAPASVDNYNHALLVPNGTNNEQKLSIHNHLGIIYLIFEEYEKCIQEFRETIKYDELVFEEGGERHQFVYNNIALGFMNLYQFDSSWHYHQKCLEHRLREGNKYRIGQTYNNLGSLFYEMEEYDSSLFYFVKGLELRVDSATRVESAVFESKINIGKAKLALKRYGEAERILLESQAYAIDESNPALELRILEQLMKLYAETNRYNKAYQYATGYYELRDNLFGMDKREEVIRLNHEHMYNQKLMHDSLMTVEKVKVDAIQKDKDEEIQRHKDLVDTIIEVSLGIALILLIGIIVLGYRNYREKQKAAKEILFQKNEAETQRDLASEQRDIAQKQKEQLVVINKEITDSITYAKRIQKAILPAESVVNRILNKSFIFYRPKAIVAGDFYWVHEVDGLVYFAAADCTGHGVPGAMVSVICSNALNRAVDEYDLRDPGEILDKTMDLLIDQLVSETENVKDGMDISLCRLDRSKNQIVYSGANNSLYIGRDSESEIIELKPTKQGIGWVEKRLSFESKSFPVLKGDTIYSFTDGFPDQFGGPQGKKYKYKTFKNFLMGIQSNSLKEQEIALANEFDQWKGDLEQLDDVCVIGVRV